MAAAPRPYRHTPHTLPASQGAPPRAPAAPISASGCVRTAAPRQFWCSPHTFRGSRGAPPRAP
eukprot:2593452-Pyramimonas_sp.AAC.1